MVTDAELGTMLAPGSKVCVYCKKWVRVDDLYIDFGVSATLVPYASGICSACAAERPLLRRSTRVYN